MTRIVHISDLHFGRPAVAEHVGSLREAVVGLGPDAIAVSGDLTQRCADTEFLRAREFLESLRETAPTVVVPGNHDIRWLWAGPDNSVRAHNFKYARYFRHISRELNPSLEVPGAVIAGLNTAHGLSSDYLTHRLRDFGVIGHVRGEDLKKVEEAFGRAAPDAARVVMTHHNPIQGPVTDRHGLANAEEALEALAELEADLVLCGHDHHDTVHYVEKIAPGLIISAAGTVSSRLRAGRPSSFNVVDLDERTLGVTTYTWERRAGFSPSLDHSFPRRSVLAPDELR